MYLSDQKLADKLTQVVLANLMAATGLKAVSSTPGGNYGHGPTGLFGNPALERDLYSAVITSPFSGLQNVLPVRGTTVTDPLDGIITGVTATTGDEPDGVCADPPTTGLVKLCQHSFPLGLFSRQTPVYNILHGNRTASRGEHRDFQVFGDPFAKQASPFAPTVPGTTANEMANTESGKILFGWMVGWARDFADKIYTGTPVNNKPGGGYKEFYGLEKLINVGYRDAESGIACPAADSIVRSFASVNVRTNGASIVQTMLMMYFVLQSNASKMNLMPARWLLVMPESLFYELTALWPCSYLTGGCQLDGAGAARVVVDAGDQVRMRDEMRGDLTNRTGQHLKMFGQDVPVIIDDAMPETALGGGVMKASIYFVPMSVLGGQPVTFLEYMDYNAIEVPQEAKKFAPDESFIVTDNGRFVLHKKPPTNLCVQIAGWTEPRLKLLTPFLAARLDNVAYNRLPDLRSGDPDSSYFVNGGLVSRANFAPSYYPPTS